MTDVISLAMSQGFVSIRSNEHAQREFLELTPGMVERISVINLRTTQLNDTPLPAMVLQEEIIQLNYIIYSIRKIRGEFYAYSNPGLVGSSIYCGKAIRGPDGDGDLTLIDTSASEPSDSQS